MGLNANLAEQTLITDTMQIALPWADKRLPTKLIEFQAEKLITCVKAINLMKQILMLMEYLEGQPICMCQEESIKYKAMFANNMNETMGPL